MPFQPYYPPSDAYGYPYPYGQIDFDFQITNGAFDVSAPVYPFRFVTLDGNRRVAQSVLGDWPIAITNQNTQAWNTNYAATPGYPVQTFGDGRDCWLMLGADVTFGQALKPDNEGRGIPALVGDCSAARAYQDGAAGTLCRVKVARLPPQVRGCYSDWSFEFSFEFGNGCG